MAGILKVDDLRGNTSAGNITITSEGGSATMQLQQGVAKCWCFFDGNGTVSLADSLNAASITDNGTGDYTFTWTNNFSTGNYSSPGAGRSYVLTGNAGTSTTSTLRIRVTGSGGTNTDDSNISTAHLGDLA